MHGHRDRDTWDDATHTWEQVGRTAERFARRMARDARRFAERVEENVGEFAHDVRREFRSAGSGSAEGEVRRIFEGLRRILGAVVDGIDELVAGFAPEPTAEGWTRVVYHHDAPCAECGRTTTAGSEGWVRRSDAGVTFRCVDCGAPPA